MNITYHHKTITIEEGATVRQCLESLGADMAGVLAVRRGDEALELDDVLDRDGELIPLTRRDEEGRRIYERTLRYVMLLAVRQEYPGQTVRVEFSVGGGVLVRLPGRELTPENVAALEARMRRIVADDLPFEKQVWPLEKAIAYFERDGQPDKAALLRTRRFPTINMFGLGGMWLYFYGALAPSTGCVPVFALTHHAYGFVLRLPGHDGTLADYIDRPKHLAVFTQSVRWCEILGVVNAPDVTRMVEEHHLRSFIRVNEALHDKAIADIAQQIVDRGRRIVLVAGPSSSGKTTFTGRLAVHLQALGKRPVMLSLDNYYLDRDALPVRPDGTVDLEALDTLDIQLLQEQLMRLLNGETVAIPRFNFKTQKREPVGVPVTLGPDQPVLMEGIHGLNPELSNHLPQELIHRVFVSALTCLNLDDHNRIRTTDVRLLRRIVRDMQFRGTAPEETLAMWKSVREGEETWIFPHQERADSVFNTALHYELPVLKHIAYDTLKAVPPEHPCALMARRLRKILNYFPDISDDVLDEIPPLSLLREFIGGCTIDKE